jgi:hypothetical protein
VITPSIGIINSKIPIMSKRKDSPATILRILLRSSFAFSQIIFFIELLPAKPLRRNVKNENC